MREESEVKILFKILMMLELMCQSICINYSYESQSSVLDFLICQGCTNKKKGVVLVIRMWTNATIIKR